MSDEDLDFTKAAPAAPPPPPAKVAEARTEAGTGGPQLAKQGFYVAMARHSTGGMVLPRDGPRHSILVVEDDPTLLKLVTEVLSQAGFKVRTARNRAEINGEINKAPLPDLLLRVNAAMGAEVEAFAALPPLPPQSHLSEMITVAAASARVISH